MVVPSENDDAPAATRITSVVAEVSTEKSVLLKSSCPYVYVGSAADANTDTGATVRTIATARSMLMIFFALLKNNPSKFKILNMK